MTAVLAFLKTVPLLVYPLVLVFLGYMWERHEVHSLKTQIVVIKAQDANDKIAALKTKADADDRIIATQKGIIDDQTKKLAAVSAAASATSSTVGQLRVRLQAISHAVSADHSASGGGISTASSTVVLLSDLLGRSTDTNAVLANALDASHQRGLGCEAQYSSLKP